MTAAFRRAFLTTLAVCLLAPWLRDTWRERRDMRVFVEIWRREFEGVT